MRTALTLALIFAATTDAAAQKIVVSPGRPGQAKLMAVLSATGAATNEKAQSLQTVAGSIEARNACGNAGLVYLPGHPQADANNCVDPSIWGMGAWQIGAWGACSTTCGGGTQSRSVICMKNGSPQPDSKCPTPKPATSQACNTHACPTCGIGWTSNANYNGTVMQGTLLYCQHATNNLCWGSWQCATCQWVGNGPGGDSAPWTMWGYRLWQNSTLQNGWTYQGISGAYTVYRCY